MSNVDRFLAETKARTGGPRCLTCSHAKKDAVEQDVLRFNDRRAGRAKDKEGNTLPQTRVSWQHFVDKYLLPTYRYKANVKSLKKHMRDCMNVELH